MTSQALADFRENVLPYYDDARFEISRNALNSFCEISNPILSSKMTLLLSSIWLSIQQTHIIRIPVYLPTRRRYRHRFVAIGIITWRHGSLPCYHERK